MTNSGIIILLQRIRISDEIRKQIDVYPEDFVFTASDFDIETQNKSALVKMLNRMVQSGYLTKLSKGKFHKPRTTPDEACKRLKEIFKSMSIKQQTETVKLALNYTNYVRALCGAILEDIKADTQLWSALFNSLSGISEYKLPISESILPTKKKWDIV